MTWEEAAALAPIIHARWWDVMNERWPRTRNYPFRNGRFHQLAPEQQEMITAWVLAAAEHFGATAPPVGGGQEGGTT